MRRRSPVQGAARPPSTLGSSLVVSTTPPPSPPLPAAGAPWTRTQWLVFAGTYVAYASCYLARNNAAVAKSALGADLGFSVGVLGNLDASFLVAYTLGSFTLGSVTDRLGAWPCLLAGLLGAGASQAGLAWAHPSHPAALGSLYALNGLCQSILYPACKKLMGEHFGEGQRGAALGSWSTCYYLGSMLSTALASQLLAGSSSDGWRVVFAVPALALPWLALALVPLSNAVGSSQSLAATQSPSVPDAETAGGAGHPMSIWICSLSYALIKCTRYAFLLWLPLYLIQEVHMSLGGAAFTAALFDAGSIAGSLLAGQLSDRLGQQAGLACAMLAPLSLLLCLLPSVAASSSTYPAALPLTILALGLLVGGPETLQGSVAPLRYSPPERRASSVGFVNGWGSAGTVLAAPLIPLVAQKVGGIDHAFSLLGPLAFGAAAITFLQWAVYDSKEPESATL